MRCLWLCSRPGAGLLRYRVPVTTKLEVLVADFCAVQALPAAQVRACSLDMIRSVHHAFQRRTCHGSDDDADDTMSSDDCSSGGGGGMPGVAFLDHNHTLEQLHIVDNYLIDLIYRPSPFEYSV